MTGYVFKRIDAQSVQFGAMKSLSLSLCEPYCANATINFYELEDVEAFIAELRQEAERIWPERSRQRALPFHQSREAASADS